MQRVTPTLTKLESSSAAFRHPRPEPRDQLPQYSIHLLTSLRRHLGLAVLVALLTFLAGFGYLYMRYGRSFYAESIVYVSPSYPEILPQPFTLTHAEEPYDPLIEQQVNTVTRRDILTRAIHQLPADYFPKGSDQDKAAALAGSLAVERTPNSYQIKIGLHGTEPARIADIVNKVTQSYLDTAQKEEFFGRDQAVAVLQKEHDQLNREMSARQDEQYRIEHDLGVATFNPGVSNPFNERITKLNTDLVDARDRLHAAESELEALQSDDQASYNAAMRSEASDLVSNDSGLNGLKLALANRRSQLVAAMAGMTEANPARQQDEVELADIDRSLARMTSDATNDAVHRLEARYRTTLLRSRDYEARVSHDLAVAEAEAALAAPKFQQILNLTSAIAHDTERLHAIEDRIVSLNLESNVPGSIHLASPAQRPDQGETRKEYVLLLVLIPFALAVGLGSAVLRDAMDELVHSPGDVERTVGLPPVGILFDRNEVSPRIENEYAFRLGATLDHARRTANVRSFAFTSVRSEQGTTTVVNLVAAEMAQLGNRVLVLDAADQREPVAFIPPEQDDPHGNPRPRLLHPELDLLVSSRGRNLPSIAYITDSFRRIHGDFDALLLDCAPLLISADSEYQVRQADATLLIAEAGATRKADLLRAARLLDRLRVPGLAIVLNRLHMDRAGGGLRNDVKAYEAHGRRLPNFFPGDRSPLIDGNTFQTPELRPDEDLTISDPEPRRRNGHNNGPGNGNGNGHSNSHDSDEQGQGNNHPEEDDQPE